MPRHRNRCLMEWGWDNRLSEMKSHFGERFNCLLPGVWGNTSRDYPVCNKFEKYSNNDSLGLSDLMRNPLENFNHNFQTPLMIHPPIGIYRNTANCISRCRSYTYTLNQYHVSDLDDVMHHPDIHLFFSSPTVESYREFRLQSRLDLLSNMGGAMGLILGLSILSVTLSLMEMFKSGMQIFFNKQKEDSAWTKEGKNQFKIKPDKKNEVNFLSHKK